MGTWWMENKHDNQRQGSPVHHSMRIDVNHGSSLPVDGMTSESPVGNLVLTLSLFHVLKLICFPIQEANECPEYNGQVEEYQVQNGIENENLPEPAFEETYDSDSGFEKVMVKCDLVSSFQLIVYLFKIRICGHLNMGYLLFFCISGRV